MNYRDRPLSTFLALGVGAFLVADVGFEVLARLWIGRNPLGQATSETLYSLATQPVGTLMLLAPFLLIAWMAASLARRRTFERGLLLFMVAAGALGVLYFVGHVEAEQALKSRRWTAAALSVGLLPFESIPVLLLALIARWLLARKSREVAI
jgi:hypothetical protein